MDIKKRELIDSCEGDFDVRYALSTHGRDLYAAYYESGSHKLKIAKRDVSGEWQRIVLDERVNWDSHKYITMVIDSEGYIHLSANMHNDPLVYYKSEKPGDITSMKKQGMTGIVEDSVTYPEFLRKDDRLFFHYREGRSGNGSTFVNRYDPQSKRWEKLSEKPLFDGKERMNAYFKGPFLGPDKRFHLIWCWRDTSDCSTNHGLYYASSSDLKEWTTPGGYSHVGPITPDNNEFLVDDVKAGGGLINGGFAVGFHYDGRPLIVYHKYDENNHTNIHLADFVGSDWKVVRITDWSWKWDFSGRGSVPFLLDIKDVWTENDKVVCYYSKITGGNIFSAPKMQDYLVKYDETTGNSLEVRYMPYPSKVSKPRKRKQLVHVERDRHKAETGKSEGETLIMRYETQYPARDKRGKKRKRSSDLEMIVLSN